MGFVTVLSLLVGLLGVTGEVFNLEEGDSIQNALNKVKPGDTIKLGPGKYFENIKTVRDGELDNRITLRGPGEDEDGEAVLRGENSYHRMFELYHDYYTIEHFTIDGELDDDDEEYMNKLFYVLGKREPRLLSTDLRPDPYYSSVDGLIVRNMNIKNAGGECVRLRYFVTNADIYDNRIEDCGVQHYVIDTDSGSKNGEGVYIGTSNKMWDDGTNPTDAPVESNWNWVHDNHFNTMGNKAVDIKEGSSFNIIEHNDCFGQMDELSGGIDVRGNDNIVLFNKVERSLGAGVRLGGATVDGKTYGSGNEVYGNTLIKNEFCGVKIMVGDQKTICGNRITPTSDDDYEYEHGPYASKYDSREDCDFEPTPAPAVEPTPAPTPEPISIDGYVKVTDPDDDFSTKAGKKITVEWNFQRPSGNTKSARFFVDLHECVDGDCGDDGCGQFITKLCPKEKGCAKNKTEYTKKLPQKNDIAKGDNYVIRVEMRNTGLFDCGEKISITNGKLDSNF